jgi:hypothetical protein
MSSNPDEIREQIEVTRNSLSTDVNTLADTVKPRNVAHRQAEKVRTAAGDAKDRIMGTASDVGSAGSSKLGDAGSRVGDVASSSQQAVKSAPGVVRAQTQGNPLAVGLIAFGAGWLIGSLIPASNAEQEAAQKAKENASVVTDQVSAVARETGENLREPAQNAAEAVRSTAADAAENVKSESASAAAEVKDQGVEAKQAVQESRR